MTLPWVARAAGRKLVCDTAGEAFWLCIMNPQAYVDVVTAKERVIRYLREFGPQPFSRLLMGTQLPESLLTTVLRILENERKVGREVTRPKQDETVYLPLSGLSSIR